MTSHEQVIALGVLNALSAARLVPDDGQLASASTMAIPHRGAADDLFRENTFLAIRSLRMAIEAGDDKEKLESLHFAAVEAATLWVEARSSSK